ncbi:6742_t:CDS:2, partial [Dentiscutata heterogama]
NKTSSKIEFNKHNKSNKIYTNTSSENDDSKENVTFNSENGLNKMKSMASHNETNVNQSGRPTDVPPEESIGETGRLFVRNLPYVCSEEDLQQIFNKFGPLAEVHIPLQEMLLFLG